MKAVSGLGQTVKDGEGRTRTVKDDVRLSRKSRSPIHDSRSLLPAPDSPARCTNERPKTVSGSEKTVKDDVRLSRKSRFPIHDSRSLLSP